MDLDLFEKIIIDLKKRGQGIVPLQTIGEPLINPLLEEYFKILRSYKISTFLSTNGQVLDKKLDLLIRYSDVIDTLRFSIDGATKETYEKIRRPGKFDKLIENLNAFNEINKKRKIFRFVKIDSIVSEDVQHELAYHLKFYSKYTDMNNIGLHLMNGLSPDNSYFFGKNVLKKYIMLNNSCKQLEGGSNIIILNDGRVTACCRDYNGDLIYGSIMENTPDELISGQRIKQLREYHRMNKFPPNHLCSNCYEINPVVVDLWENFIWLLVRKNSNYWVVELMQKKIDNFFEQFKDKIPSEKEYISLF
jgi:MoaA/NifB/PqqE/SkfB family radical SAM enzyme